MKRLLLIALCCIAASASAQSNRARALLASGERHEKAGHLDEAARDYLAARVEAERTGDGENVADAWATLGFLRYCRGEMNEALVDLRRAQTLKMPAQLRGLFACFTCFAPAPSEVYIPSTIRNWMPSR